MSSCLPSLHAEPGSRVEWHVYIGTYTGERSRGIYAARFNSENGALSQPWLAAEARNPSFLAVHPKGKTLYAVSEVNDFNEKRQGSVGAYRIANSTGTLTPLNEQGSGGSGPCHLAIDRKGKCVLVANYGSGSLATLAIQKDGFLREARSVIQHRGSSINVERQEGPHAHHIALDKANRFALACDLGLDKVLIYKLVVGKPGLTPNLPYAVLTEPGSGPRHLVFSPDGNHVYVLNEMGCTVGAYGYEPRKGRLDPIHTVSTVPATFKGNNTCAEIQVHPSGRYVYASNRGHDSIAAFRIAPESGGLSPIGHFPSGGKTPRHFAIDPTGHWLLAENQNSDNITVFAIDNRDGKLIPTGQVVAVGAPVCLVFTPAK